MVIGWRSRSIRVVEREITTTDLRLANEAFHPRR
jgi:hypothetical protein